MTYILGGAQTDFALNLARRGEGLRESMKAALEGALADARLEPPAIETIHVGNFCAELFTGQGQLGAMLATAEPVLYGVPAMRHEAACASGGVAVLCAMAELEAGRYDCALVLGVEIERNVSGKEAARHLASAAWVGHEGEGVTYLWPSMFGELAETYAARFGLRYEHLARIAEINLANAKRNPNAQTRGWTFGPESFSEDDEANPPIAKWVRRQDCGQVTDGSAAIVLASPRFAAEWARARGRSIDSLPRIAGFGHRTASLGLADKLARTAGSRELVFPHVRRAIDDAFGRAGVRDIAQIDGIETHDCFSMSEYMAIDHFGLTAPGESWRAIEEGVIERGGRCPINPSGGLIGVGHPVGATGVRMLVDAGKQVAGTAGELQVGGARRFATLNIGGSTTTTVSFVVERGAA
jgi:acetyl-CoA C-acetyltransferase